MTTKNSHKAIVEALVDNFVSQNAATNRTELAKADNKKLHEERINLIEQLGKDFSVITTQLSIVLGALVGTKAQKQAYKRSLARALKAVHGDGQTYRFKLDRLIVEKAEVKEEPTEIETIESMIVALVGPIGAVSVMKSLNAEIETVRKETVRLRKRQETRLRDEKAETVARLRAELAELEAEQGQEQAEG